MAQDLESPEQVSVADGAVASFATIFTFEFASEVRVTVDDGDGAVLQTEGVDYDLSAGDWLTAGANVVFRAGHVPADGAKVGRQRITRPEQPEPFGDLEAFRPVQSETAYDRLTRGAQDARAALARALSAPLGETGFELEPQATREGGVAEFRNGGLRSFRGTPGSYLGLDADGLLTGLGGGGADDALRADLAGGTGTLVGFKGTGDGAVARSFRSKLADVVSVKDHGAVGDGVTRPLSDIFLTLAGAQLLYPFVTSLDQTRDWAGIMSAAAHSQAIELPSGTYACDEDEILLTRPTRIIGRGANMSMLTWNASVNGINMAMVDTSADGSYHAGLHGLALVNAMAAGTPTAGAGLAGEYVYFGEITDVRINNFYDGINFVQCPVTNIRGLNITTFNRYGFASTGGHGFDCRITDFVISGQLIVDGEVTIFGEYGIFLDEKNDEFVFLNGIVNFCVTGLYTDATTFAVSECPEFLRFINVSFDSNSVGIDLANCAEVVFDLCFISNRPNSGVLIGQRGSTRNVKFSNSTFQTNGGAALVLFSGAKFTNCINCSFLGNGASSGPGVAHGVVVQSGVTDFAFIGCDFSNGWGGGVQNFGLFITAANCNRFAIIGNNFGASGGAFVNSSTGTEQEIHGNLGYRTQARGTVTLVAGTAAVAMPTNFPAATYRVTLAGDLTTETFGWSGKSVGGFTITSSNAASTASVDWTATL